MASPTVVVSVSHDNHSREKADEEVDEHDSKPEVFDEELENLLKTDIKTGLNDSEAQERKDVYGPNELAEKKTNPVLKLLGYFNGPIAWLIEAAVILAGASQDWVDFGIILALLLINAFIGFSEESKAESALNALKNTLAQKSKVKRNSELIEIDSKDLVPGDLVVIRLGDIVPADCRLLGIGASEEKQAALHIDQSALTGESLPVKKNVGAIAYSSSIVKQGQQMCVVVKTGSNTYIGRAAKIMSETNERGHFQIVIGRIGNFLIIVTLVLVIILLITLLVNHNPVLSSISFVLVLTIAAIPVGLPTVLSVTMAVGAKQLAKRQVIVKRLPAIEELAGISVLCSDKTGTLTLNELKLVDPWLSPGSTKEDLLLYAFLASEAGANDPIELAVRNGAVEQIPQLVGSDIAATSISNYEIQEFNPFNPHTKMTSASIMQTDKNVVFKVCKGAPPVIIRLCGDNPEWTKVVTVFGGRGFRCLGVARTANNSDAWKLVGFLAFLDPPRPDSASTIRETRAMGVSVKMITGDQLVIAKEVSSRLGLSRALLNAEKLNEDVDEAVLAIRCTRADGFAQVIPEDKFKVVDLLQKKGLLVGMTGDGVNDAPALKKANVGIAVHGCTDAARSAADIVLLSPGLSNIVYGIQISRAIFQRMRSYALYRMSSTIHFLMFFFWAILFLNFALPAKLIVLIAILNDAAALVISVDNAKISSKPDKWRLGQLMTMSFIFGILFAGASFAFYFVGRDVFGLTYGQLQTVIYLQLSANDIMFIFGTRLAGYFWTSRPSVVFMCAIFATQLFALLISIFGGVSDAIGYQWGLSIYVITFGYFVIMDAIKVQIYRRWSFGLTVKLFPTPGRRNKLKKKIAAKKQHLIFQRAAKKFSVFVHAVKFLLSLRQNKHLLEDVDNVEYDREPLLSNREIRASVEHRLRKSIDLVATQWVEAASRVSAEFNQKREKLRAKYAAKKPVYTFKEFQN